MPIDATFIGSCTNARLEDLRQAAAILRGRKVAAGIRAILAPDFGVIFADNCIRNGLLPLVLDGESIGAIAAWVQRSPADNRVLIDLPAQTVTADGQEYSWAIDAGAKRMLVEGLDAIALTQTRWEAIEAFHEKRREQRPWLY